MTNFARGETDIVLAGKSYRIGFVTMGALAEIAAALGDENMPYPVLIERITRGGAADAPKILRATLKANGHDVSDDDVTAADPKVFSTLTELMFTRPGDAKSEGEARPPRRQKA